MELRPIYFVIHTRKAWWQELNLHQHLGMKYAQLEPEIDLTYFQPCCPAL